MTDREARDADEQFRTLTGVPNLDRKLRANPAMAARFERVLARALPAAYSEGAGLEGAHRFIQRALYRVNRLDVFWYDDVRRYVNERSPYLMAVRERIEHAWQAWESRAVDVDALRALDVPAALIARTRADAASPPSAADRYVADEATAAGYRRLVEIAALGGLVEASQRSRILGGPAGEIQATLARVFVEEYGEESGLSAEPEAHFDVVPWEVLASINERSLLSDRRRHFLRYVGGLLYVETAAPAAARHYAAAARRLGVAEHARRYREVQIREHERHGPWMLDRVAVPLAARYPADAWELALGYDQQKAISERASAAVVRAARDADQAAYLRAVV